MTAGHFPVRFGLLTIAAGLVLGGCANSYRTFQAADGAGPGSGSGPGPGPGASATPGGQLAYASDAAGRYGPVIVFFTPRAREDPAHERLGLKLGVLTDKQKRWIRSKKGLGITAVVKGSPAHNAGIHAQDILLSVGGRAVYDMNTAVKVIDEAKDGDTVLEIIRGGRRRTKVIKYRPGE